jgi:hypothetical protein
LSKKLLKIFWIFFLYPHPTKLIKFNLLVVDKQYIFNNLVYNCTYASGSTGLFTAIYNSATPAYMNVYQNIVRDNSLQGTGTFTGIDAGGGTTMNYYANKVYNNTKNGTGLMYCMRAGTSQVSLVNNEIHDNSIVTSGTAAGSLYGFYDLSSPTVETYTGNQIYNLTVSGSSTSTSSLVRGIHSYTVSTSVKNWSLNLIHDLSISAPGGGTVYGMYTQVGTTINIFRNKIYNLSSSGSTPTVNGIYVNSGTTVNLYNNLIGNLETPSANATIPLAGINFFGGTTINAYYNTIYLNATSTGALFGSAAVYASTTPTVVLRNNILVNTSTATGTGRTAAYRRSSTTLTTYGSASNNNFLYTGTPDTNNVIFYDGTATYQTLNDFKALVTPRDNVSVTNGTGPAFLSTVGSDAAFLHMDPTVPSPIESGSAILTGYDNDYDNDIRFGAPGYPGGGSAPDIGADEYSGLPNYTCTTPAPGATVSTANPVCLGQSITLSLQNFTPGTGVNYQWMWAPDGVSYSNIIGALDATYTFAPTVHGFYQCKVTCQNGPVFAISTPIHITFANSITSTTPGSRCGVGTVQLQAAGSAGTTIAWYAAATGGAVLGSGSPFTTPVISSTTTFYAGAETYAPGTAIVGAGATTSSSYPCPLYSLWSNLHTQHLIKAEELLAAGLGAGIISSLALDLTNAGTLPVIDFSIKIAHTTATDMSAFVSPAFTTVYTNASYTPTAGLNVFTFTPAFIWDGASNIVIEYCHGNPSSSATMSRACKVDNTSYVSVIKTHVSSATPAATVCADITTNKLTYSIRPQYYINGQSICSSTRTGVVAAVASAPALSITTDKTICNDEISAINVLSTIGDFDTYTWSPATSLFTDAACTVPYVALTSATTVYFKSNVAGQTVYTCTATNNTSLCVNTATSSIVVLPAALTITASPPELCYSGSSVISVTPTTGYGTATFQWQISDDNIVFTDIVGATGFTYTTDTITSTKYYKFVVRNGAGAICLEALDTLVVNTPAITSTTPGSRCGVGSVTLGATSAGGTVTWYTTPTGGTAVGSGSPWVTPVINATTSYYVGSITGSGASGSVGAPNNSIGSGGAVALTYYLIFDVLASSMRIEGVYVYPGAVGDVKLHISNSAGTVLHTITYPVTATGVKTYIPIGYELPSGTAYRLGWYTGGVSLYRNTTGSAFPYTMPGVVSITGHNFSGYPQYYYYCYDWQVSSGCSSPRTEVVASVVPGPPFSVGTSQTICNDAVATMQVTSIISDYDTYVWSPNTNLFTDAAGTIPYDGVSSYSTIYARSATQGSTTYTCTATKIATQCVSIGEVTIDVIHANPTISAVPPNICVSGSSVLSVAPSTGWASAFFQWQDSPDNITFTDIPGAVSSSYSTPTLSATKYYRCLIKNSIGQTCSEPTFTLEVFNPQVTGTTPGTRCGIGSVTLGAAGTPGSTLNWYAAASGGLVLGTGTSFATPVINSTTTYYVGASNGFSVSSVGAPNTSISTTMASQTTTTAGINFDVTGSSAYIQSMDIYPTAAVGSPFTIMIKLGTDTIASYSGVTTVSGTITAPVVQTVPVSFTIPSGTGYRALMVVNPGTIRNGGGDAFPYILPGVITLTSSTLAGYYYYMYNWVVQVGCESVRSAVTANVTAPPALTSSATPPEVCLGSSTTLNVSSGNPTYTYLWTPGDLAGASQVVSPATPTTYIVTATDAGSGCVNKDTVIVNVNPVPTAVTVTPPSSVVGSIQQLVASGGTIGGDYTFGTGTGTNTTTGYPAPYTNYYGGVKHQLLILASELTAAGMTAGPINSMTFRVSAVGTTFSGSLSSFQISMKNTTTSVLTGSSFESGLTLVYGPLTQAIPTTGLPANVSHAITPFVWDGTSNLIIETSYSNGNAGTSTDFVQMYNTSTSFVSCNWFRADSQTPAYILAAATPTSSGSVRPNIILNAAQVTNITWSPLSDLYTDALGTIPYTGTPTNTVYANPAGAVTYTATATSLAGCTNTGTCEFTANKTLNVKLLFEGLAADRGFGPPAPGTMFQAYNESGPQWPAGVADKVTIELRNGLTGALIFTISDADVSTSGDVSVSVPAVHNGSYYVYVKHRNSITTSTANPVSFSGATVTYDFTTGSGQAFGSNMKDVSGYSYMFSGDENQDGLVDSSDLIDCDNDSASFAAGYLVTDTNGDGLVDSSDMNIIDNNNAAFIGALLPF